MKKVFAVISAKNRKKETLKCIESLYKQTYKDIEILLVDDGSNDGLAKIVKEVYPNIKIIAGDGNLWFTRAMNLGISDIMSKAQGDDYVLLLNNDVVFDSDYVEQLVESIGESSKTCIGSINKSLKEKSLMYVMHKQISGITRPIKIDFKNSDHLLASDVLNTRGTLVPVKIFKDIGLLSKLFPHYGSDYDFFYRAKKAGYKLIVDTKAIVYSQDDDKGLSGRIREKRKITFREFFQLFFNRRSSFNLYSRTLLVLLYTPFPQKVVAIAKILLNVPYVFFKKVLF